MKKYVFLACDIHSLGGGQTYINTKIKFLEQKGYLVYVFSTGNKYTFIPYKNLKKYNETTFYDFLFPPMCLKNSRIKRVLKKFNKVVRPNNEDEIIIESYDDKTAFWGEIIAKKFNCKHFCFSINEVFEGNKIYYKDNIDFFKFKFERKELAFISRNWNELLFDNEYKDIDTSDFVLVAYSNAVEDIDNIIINKIKKYDFNIAYIGRYNKLYVANILNDIVLFSKNHENKTIGFTLVGDSIEHKMEIFKYFNNLKNIHLFFTGTLIPMPKKLFSKFDAIIAGAGCARFSYFNSKYVIVPDASNGKCNGLLGYDTMDRLYHEEGLIQTDFCTSLENALVKRVYDDKGRKTIVVEDSMIYYEKHLEFINDSNQDSNYYDINRLKKMSKPNKLYFKCLIHDYMFFIYSFKSFFGRIIKKKG